MRSEPSKAAALAIVLALAGAAPAASQATGTDSLRVQLEESQARLQQIRAERDQLQRELAGLDGQVHNVSEEIQNLERQIAASASLMAELDIQLATILDQVTIMTRDMLLTRDQLTARKAVLNQRLREIYKRGPLRTIQVLLSSRSFSDLLNRYKYLHDVAMFDRLLVGEVADLERDLAIQRTDLAGETERIAFVRDEKRTEMAELQRLEVQRQRRLSSFATRQAEARTELAQLATEEEQLRQVLADLDARRRAAERTAGTASVSLMTTADLGQLEWPVEGQVLYQFGPQRDGSTTILREGIGIAAPRGTPVRAVESGRVAYTAPRPSGQTLIIDHGGGFYSAYQMLQTLIVQEGQQVDRGQMIGRVGGDVTNPHIEFQIYEPGSTGQPRAVDPVRWLRERAGS